MLLPRVLTAVVGIPLLLYVVHLGGVPFLVLTVGMAVLALHEYAMLLWLGGRGVQRTLTVAGGGLLALSVALSAPTSAGPAKGLVPLVVTVLVAAVMLHELVRRDHSLDRAAVSLLGMFLVGWTLGHLVLIRELSPHGEALTFLLFVSVWTTDSAAYFVGLTVGRRKLAKVVSPKKSWEGAAAGLIGAVAAAWLAHRFFCQDWLTPRMAVGLGLLAGTLGQFSDLVQSLVKRASGLKDSGSLLPGHGGVFDRMDSLLLLAPAYFYVWTLLGPG